VAIFFVVGQAIKA